MRGGSYLCHESYCWRYRVDSGQQHRTAAREMSASAWGPTQPTPCSNAVSESTTVDRRGGVRPSLISHQSIRRSNRRLTRAGLPARSRMRVTSPRVCPGADRRQDVSTSRCRPLDVVVCGFCVGGRSSASSGGCCWPVEGGPAVWELGWDHRDLVGLHARGDVVGPSAVPERERRRPASAVRAARRVEAKVGGGWRGRVLATMATVAAAGVTGMAAVATVATVMVADGVRHPSAGPRGPRQERALGWISPKVGHRPRVSVSAPRIARTDHGAWRHRGPIGVCCARGAANRLASRCSNTGP